MMALQGHTGGVRCVAYSPDGRILASGDAEGKVRLWTIPGGEKVGLVQVWSGGIEALAFAPTQGWLACSYPSGFALFQKDLAARQTCSNDPNGSRGLVWRPGHETIACGGWDSHIRILTSQLTDLVEPRSLLEPIVSLASSPDGKTLAAGGVRGALLLFDWDRLNIRHNIQLTGGIYSLAWSPDGQVLAAGDIIGTITLHNPTDATQIGTLKGHEWTVYGLAFTPDGARLLSGSADNTVRIWDRSGARPPCVYRWHSRWVTCLAVSPDGMTAAAGGADGNVVVFDLADE